jgi:hypothetical protein
MIEPAVMVYLNPVKNQLVWWCATKDDCLSVRAVNFNFRNVTILKNRKKLGHCPILNDQMIQNDQNPVVSSTQTENIALLHDIGWDLGWI